MASFEYVGNLHIHTPYSDGVSYHADVAEAGLLTKLDFLIFTDHNIRVSGIEGYYGDEQRGYVLLLMGEEVHDRTRLPPSNHLLVYGVADELATDAHDLVHLVNTVRHADGLSFIAHPDDSAVEWINAPGIAWVDRCVDGFTGLEIWNFMSRFKDYVQTPRDALRAVFRPEEVMTGPAPATLELWDQQLSMGNRVVGIGGADAHGTVYSFGPFSHTVFPYDFLFNCVNTHILTKAPLVGETMHDRNLLLTALRLGRAFIGYGIPGDPRGFRFTAQGQNTAAIMGESIRIGHGVTLQAYAPARAHIKIIHNGEVVAEDSKTQNLTHVVRAPGAYRTEVWRDYHMQERAWILSNPIYVEPNPSRLSIG